MGAWVYVTILGRIHVFMNCPGFRFILTSRHLVPYSLGFCVVGEVRELHMCRGEFALNSQFPPTVEFMLVLCGLGIA